MKNSKYPKILDSLMDDQIPQDLNLAPKILKRINHQKGAVMNKRKKVLVPTALTLVMVTAITFTVPAVAETIQRWIGYIPGFGLVHEDTLRTLVEPLDQTINGVTLRVEVVTASSDKTQVKYSLAGDEDSMRTAREGCLGGNAAPVMSLPDGSKLQDISLGTFPGNGMVQFEATYSPIPPADEMITFSLECHWQTENGRSLSSFQIPLQLTDAGIADLTVAPVLIIPTQTAPVVAEPTGERVSTVGDMQVSQVIPLEDGYILQGTLTVEPESGLTVNIFNGFLEDVSIWDANQTELLPSMVPSDFMIELDNMADHQIHWAMQINPATIAWPLTITVHSIPVMTAPYPASTFQVDVGENPQTDQAWVIDKDVPLGPKLVHVVSIKRVQDNVRMNGYEMTFIHDSSLDFSYNIAGGVPNGGGGQGGFADGDLMTIVRSYSGDVPVGVLSVQLSGQGVNFIQGPWQVTLDGPIE